MKKLLLAFIIYHSASIIGTAQNLDSLYRVWQDNSRHDSVRVVAYKDYLWKRFLFSNPDTVIILAEALHTYAKNQNYPKAAATAFVLQGSAYWTKANYTKALENFQKSLVIFEKLGDNVGIAKNLNNIGAIYTEQGNRLGALAIFEKALVLNEQSGNKQGAAGNLTNIGLIYHEQDNYPRALQYYQRSIKICEEIGNETVIAANLNNIGSIYQEQAYYPRAFEYFENALAINQKLGDKQGVANCLNNIGNSYNEQGKYTRALEFYQKGLAIDEEIGNKRIIVSSLNNIGALHKNQGNYPRALEYFTKAMAIAEENADKQGTSTSLIHIGEIYQKQGNHSLAQDYCQKGLELAQEKGILKKQRAACQCLYDTYKAMGKGNQALLYLEKLNLIEDSLQSEETTKKLQQMEFAKLMLQDSIAKAEETRLVQEAHQTEVRQKNQTRNISFGIGGLILLLAAGLYTRLRYVRKSKATLQVEKDRSENLLLNILPEEIAQELKLHGKAQARDFDLVSILFTDFKGFTEASAKLTATDLVHEINHCFEGFDAIMEKYGIEKIKTIGDAYMAAGGLPVPTDDSVKNTVLAALEMQAFIYARKMTQDAAGRPAFEMRVGIHTGPVVAGIVGVKKFQYDIWGDTVNTASRMESSGEVGKVNISQTTYEILKNDSDFVFTSRGKIEAKGKGEVEMWFVELRN